MAAEAGASSFPVDEALTTTRAVRSGTLGATSSTGSGAIQVSHGIGVSPVPK